MKRLNSSNSLLISSAAGLDTTFAISSSCSISIRVLYQRSPPLSTTSVLSPSRSTVYLDQQRRRHSATVHPCDGGLGHGAKALGGRREHWQPHPHRAFEGDSCQQRNGATDDRRRVGHRSSGACKRGQNHQLRRNSWRTRPTNFDPFAAPPKPVRIGPQPDQACSVGGVVGDAVRDDAIAVPRCQFPRAPVLAARSAALLRR